MNDMKNITVSVPGEIYYDAQVWAAQHGTSVSSLVRKFLETLPDRQDSLWENPES
jgi:hypothetical protein